MHENMNRVESAISATSSGNLTWEQWPHDCATALGFAGQKNPLGFAVVRYLGDAPGSSATWGIVLNLATELIRLGYAADKANDASWAAIDAWNNLRCNACGGRGHVYAENAAVIICEVCGGSGEKDKSGMSDIVRDGISALMEAERWMEAQLSVRLKK